MKILFVGDESNYHVALAKGLRRLGHDTVIASAGGGCLDSERDVNLCRGNGLGGAMAYAGRVLWALRDMRGLDVVHVVCPIFLSFRPPLVQIAFDYLCRNNGSVYLSAIGNDPTFYKACIDGNIFDYSELRLGHEPTDYVRSHEFVGHDGWLEPHMMRLHQVQLQKSHGVMACLYEYYKAYNFAHPEIRLGYGGIPIDTKEVEPRPITETPKKVRFMLGQRKGRILLKGADKLHDAMVRLREAYPDKCEFDVVQDVPYTEYLARLGRCDVLLDQLYSYTPATSGLLAMAQGKVAVSGGEEEFYEFIGERDLRPVVNVSPLGADDVYKKLEHLVLHPEALPALSSQSMEFVRKHNDCEVVARRHVEFWENTIGK